MGMSTTIGLPPRYIILLESPSRERTSGQASHKYQTSGGQLIGGALIGAEVRSYAGKLVGYQFTFILMGSVVLLMILFNYRP